MTDQTAMMNGVEHSTDTVLTVPVDQPAAPLERQPDGLFHCPRCEFANASVQSVSMHRYRTHDISPEKRAEWARNRSKSATGKTRTQTRGGKPGTVRTTFSSSEIAALFEQLDAGARSRFLKRRSWATRVGKNIAEWEAAQMPALRDAVRLAGNGGLVRAQLAVSEIDRERAALDKERAEFEAEREERRRADELFDRLTTATDALFPQRVPSSRIIEVADWQQHTLRMIAFGEQ